MHRATVTSIRPRVRAARRAVVGAITSSHNQNFLGASWVPSLLHATPAPWQPPLALWLLSLSPHYFFDVDRQAEERRNRRSRAQLVDDVLVPLLSPEMAVIDYGCGPGYMAIAAAEHAREVEAVDVSPGVLACAAVLNGRPNIVYETPDACGLRPDLADLAYSFAVVQHLTDDDFVRALALLRRRLRHGGTLLLHFPLPGNGYRTETDWIEDRTIEGRVKLRFALNCFGRDTETMEALVSRAAFTNVTIDSLAHRTDADSDLKQQYLLVATAD